MRQITVELEKDYTKCPRKEHNYWMEEEKDWKATMKKGKRYNWTKKKPNYKNCEDCGKELDVWDEYGQRYGVCDESCYMHLVGMSWSDFI